MIKILVLLAICGISAITAAGELQNQNVSIVFVNDVNEFKSRNPGVKLIEMTRSNVLDKAGTVRYTFGSRKPNDYLASYLSEYYTFSALRNFQLTLTYPTDGVGAVITQVVIDVQFSSNIGRAFIVSGGIGQRSIQVVLRAQSTLYYGVKSYIYGL